MFLASEQTRSSVEDSDSPVFSPLIVFATAESILGTELVTTSEVFGKKNDRTTPTIIIVAKVPASFLKPSPFLLIAPTITIISAANKMIGTSVGLFFNGIMDMQRKTKASIKRIQRAEST